jgi:hypothetical protein
MGVHTVLTTTHITPGLTSQSILVDGVPDFVSILLSLLPITFSQNISQDALRPLNFIKASSLKQTTRLLLYHSDDLSIKLNPFS